MAWLRPQAPWDVVISWTKPQNELMKWEVGSDSLAENKGGILPKGKLGCYFQFYKEVLFEVSII